MYDFCESLIKQPVFLYDNQQISTCVEMPLYTRTGDFPGILEENFSRK